MCLATGCFMKCLHCSLLSNFFFSLSVYYFKHGVTCSISILFQKRFLAPYALGWLFYLVEWGLWQSRDLSVHEFAYPVSSTATLQCASLPFYLCRNKAAILVPALRSWQFSHNCGSLSICHTFVHSVLWWQLLRARFPVLWRRWRNIEEKRRAEGSGTVRIPMNLWRPLCRTESWASWLRCMAERCAKQRRDGEGSA